MVYNAYRVVPEYVMEYSKLLTHGRSAVSLPRVYGLRAPGFRARVAARIHRLNALAPAVGSVPPFYNVTVPPVFFPTSTTSTVDDGACYLCTKDPSTCKCGLNSRKQCKYCKNQPYSCTCPVFKTASGKEIPFRCLTPLLQGWVNLRNSNSAVSGMQNPVANSGHQRKSSTKKS